jgi:hypothetical protein
MFRVFIPLVRIKVTPCGLKWRARIKHCLVVCFSLKSRTCAMPVVIVSVKKSISVGINLPCGYPFGSLSLVPRRTESLHMLYRRRYLDTAMAKRVG